MAPSRTARRPTSWRRPGAAENLLPKKSLLDATSGNTGIAFAMIGAAEGFAVTLCMPENVSVERKRILRAYGANIIYTDPADGSDGAIRAARETYAQEPEKYFYADQYSNRRQLAGSLPWHSQRNLATDGRTYHALRLHDGHQRHVCGNIAAAERTEPKIRCISLQPDSPFHGIEGAKHMASAIVPKIYDPSIADEDLGISTEESYAMCKRLAREEGLLVGISSAAAVVGCLQVARRLPTGEHAVLVAILPDSGDKYLSERFWEEDLTVPET